MYRSAKVGQGSRWVAQALVATAALWSVASSSLLMACAKGGKPPPVLAEQGPKTCPEALLSPVEACINQRFLAAGERGWTLDVGEVIEECIEEEAGPCGDCRGEEKDAAVLDAGTIVDAGVIVVDGGTDPDSGSRWPAICEAQVQQTYNSPPAFQQVETPDELTRALEVARSGCPPEPQTCRLSALTYEIGFGGLPSVLELDAAVGVALRIIPAPRTWERRLGEVGPRSLPVRDVETVFSALGPDGSAVVDVLEAQGDRVEFARFVRVLQERRERIRQDVVLTLAKQGESRRLILVEVDLPQ